jgi:SAM-dependent methyltransferase
MPLNSGKRRAFFGDPKHDDDLPVVNAVFWTALIGHIEEDSNSAPRVILDVGCHTGGLLSELNRKFSPLQLFGIEPLSAARREASRRLRGTPAKVKLLDPSEWGQLPSGGIDLITSHEMLYLELDLQGFMKNIRRVLAPDGTAYLVLGCHSENPLWETWKKPLIAAGHHVYDHKPIEIMKAASSAGLSPSVQPLRRSGWIAYNPLQADFHYPSIASMLDHHYRFKLIFRFSTASYPTHAS